MVNEESISIWKGSSYQSSSPVTASVPIISSTISTKTFENLLFKYLWNNTPDKVKRVTMYANKDQGGLNMPNIQYQDTPLSLVSYYSYYNYISI